MPRGTQAMTVERQRVGMCFTWSAADLVMNHPPYCLVLFPANFWLFPELSSVTKGKRFSDAEDSKL
jgi:hypothetical protein